MGLAINFIYYTTGGLFVKLRLKFTKIFYDYIEKLCEVRYNSCKYNYRLHVRAFEGKEGV